MDKRFIFTPFRLSGVLQIALFLIIASFFVACNKRYGDAPAYSAFNIYDYPNKSVGRFKTSYLADQIDNYYRGTNPGPIGVTTFVNLDDLYDTSTFGRILGEQLMSELAMRGYDVIELRQSDALQFLSSAGEFGLSRDVSMVKKEREVGGVLVGTYAVSPDRVYVNTRLVDPATSLILSVGSVEMDKTDEIAKLVRGGGVASPPPPPRPAAVKVLEAVQL